MEITQESMNEYLHKTRTYDTIYATYEQANENKKINHQPLTRYIKVSRLYVALSYKLGGVWYHFKTNMAKEYDIGFKDKRQADPIQAYAIFARVVKPIKYQNIQIDNLGGYQDNHLDKKGKYDYAICYDVNKSYFNACRNPMPTEMIDEWRQPLDGEVGFNFNGIPIIGPSSTKCLWIFKLEEMPRLNRYFQIYSKKLLNAKNKDEKQFFKDEINYSLGNLSHHNPFLRNMIVWYSNQFIKSKVDENTIWSNTDSIVSTVKRPDLDIGNEIGQFKIEHEGKFIHAGTGYQWIDDKVISNKGISKDQVKLYEKKYNKQFILSETSTEELADLLIWRFDYGKETLERLY